MSTLTPGREGETSGGAGSNAFASDRADHEAQARASLSTRPQAHPPVDGLPNSGEHTTAYYWVLVTLRDLTF